MASIVFKSVSKKFGEVVALNEFSLDVADGEFIVLVGPSGSGKTTALRILAGLEAQTSGHVYIADRSVDRLSARDRDIAMVFQDYALYPQMSVFDNLAFGLRVRRIGRVEIRKRVQEAAAVLGLSELLRRKPAQLSGGQRQRVALGRALVRRPQVFLMDEPLSNLDAKLRAETRGEIKRIQQTVGTTTVYVTHDQVEAMTMGDRIVVMRDGRIEQAGSPESIYANPANTFVGGFIGSPAMSFGRFTVSGRNGQLLLSSGVVELEAQAADTDVPTADVIVGARPEHARLWESNGHLLGPLQGTVTFEEALGRETLLGVTLPNDLRFVVIADGLVRPRIGDAIRFGLRRGSLYLFNPETGELIGRL